MITVKFYGLLRIESGVKELMLQAETVKELCDIIPKVCSAISPADLKSCVAIVNGKRVNGRKKLNDGDIVQFFSPAAGG